MRAELVHLPKRMIVGIAHRGPNDHAEIAKIWQELNERIEEIKNIEEPDVLYGLCEPIRADEDQINYLAGVEVSRIENVPPGMQAWYVTHEVYLAVAHENGSESIGKSFDVIYHETLPKMGLHPTDDYDFELYKRTAGKIGLETVQLFVPVRKEAKQTNPDGYRKIRQKMFGDEKKAKDKK